MARDGLSPLFTWRSAIVDSDLSSTSKLVALVLSLHMSERGESCFPSYPTLAKETGLTRRTVIVHVENLVRSGWLEKTVGGGRRSNVYRAVVPQGCSTFTPPVNEQDGRGAGRSPESDIESVEKTSSSRRRERDPLFDALANACGMRLDAMTKEAARLCGIAAAEIRAAGGDVVDVSPAIARYRRRYPDAAVTPKAIANHWPSIVASAGTAVPPCPDCGVGGGQHTDECERGKP